MAFVLAASDAASAQAATGGTSASLPLFVLIVTLCILVFMITTSVSVGSRLDRIEQSLRNSTSSQDAKPPEAFSWNPALQTAFGKLPLLDGQLELGASGLYLIGVRNTALLPVLAANCVHDALEADKGTVLFASSRIGQERLGRLLLSLQAETSWDALDEAEQNEVLRRLEPRLRRYEEMLHVLSDLEAEAGVSAYLERLEEAPPRVVILDDPRGLQRGGDEADVYLDRLRMLTEKSCVPFVLLVPSQDSGHFTRWQTVLAEAFTAILEAEPQGAGIALRAIRGGTPTTTGAGGAEGDSPGIRPMLLDAASGRLTVTGREPIVR